jgi:hypothetical protein
MVMVLEMQMPQSRHRVRDLRYVVSGNYQTYGAFPSSIVQIQTVGENKVCDDSITVGHSKRVPHALLIVTTDTKLPLFNGRFPVTGTPTKQLFGCPADYNPAPPSPTSKYPPLNTVQESSLAWESLAATNPNVAHVSLPTFWAELKDLPSLWRTWGDKQVTRADKLWSALKRSNDIADKAFVRNTYDRRAMNSKTPFGVARFKELLALSPKAMIWYRWGWVPLISDIRKMFQFTRAVSQRLQWFQRLMSGDRVLKRKATIRNTTDYDTPTTVQLKSVGANIQGRRTVIYTEKVWCSVQWKLVSGGSIPGLRADQIELDPLWVAAQQSMIGWSSQDALSALWEILPWSWFVDWFLHVQTVMDATKNTIPVTWGDICLMRHTTAKALVSPLSSSSDLSWCKPSGTHQQSGDRKQRLLVSPVLPFAPSMLPVFTTGQWSILGSLAVLRAVR